METKTVFASVFLISVSVVTAISSLSTSTVDPHATLNSSASTFLIHSRLNPSHSFLTTFESSEYLTSCSCGGTDNLVNNGMWVSWDNQRGSRPDNAVYAGSDTSGSMYVMRALFNNGLIVGKYTPEVKGAWIPYGGQEYGGITNFEILRNINYIWDGSKSDINLWIPGGNTSSGKILYICRVFHIINPGAVYPMAYNIPGKYEDDKCWISYGGIEYGYDQAGSGPGAYQILKRQN